MARLITCGFETGDFFADGVLSSNPNSTIVTTTPRTGTYCMQSVTASSTTSSAAWPVAGAAISRDYWCRFGLRISANPANAVSICSLLSATSARIVQVRLNTNGTLDLLDSTGTKIGSSSAALTPGQWYRIEFYFNIATTTTGKCEMRVDGTTVTGTNITNANLGSAAPTNGLSFGINPAAISTATLLFDDIALNDSVAGAGGTSWPGDGKIVALFPTSDNSVGTGWTRDNAGTTGLFNAVDNKPPAGVADTTAGSGNQQIRNATSNANVSYIATLTTYTAAGLISTDTLTCMQAVIATGAPSATSPKTGSFGSSSNPNATGDTMTYYHGTTIAGAYVSGGTPTGWALRRGVHIDATHGLVTGWPTSGTYGTAPTFALWQTTASTRVAMCCLIVLIVEYVPGAPSVAGTAQATATVTASVVTPTAQLITPVVAATARAALTGLLVPTAIAVPDADLATTGWTTTPLFSKVNDGSDATVITATLV